MKTISILGATGSIGRSACELARRFPERYRITSLTAHRSVDRLEALIREFKPSRAAVATEEDAARLRDRLGPSSETRVLSGADGLRACARDESADVILSAIVGTAGLVPTLAAVTAGKTVALANKESLVTAGGLIRAEADRAGAVILPVDSEHSAVFQCLEGSNGNIPRRILLTASGGAFRDHSTADLETVTVQDALAHPNWSMGPKITVDSATLMNKGLEVIEARWLFDLPPERIDVLVHPESIVHSIVEFADGAMIAQMGVPDMQGPIAYALSYPERLPAVTAGLDLVEKGQLTFRSPDTERFPCLAYAYEALKIGGTLPTAMNTANEVAVAAFLEGKIPFLGIPRVIRSVMNRTRVREADTLENIMEAVDMAEQNAREAVEAEAAPVAGGTES